MRSNTCFIFPYPIIFAQVIRHMVIFKPLFSSLPPAGILGNFHLWFGQALYLQKKTKLACSSPLATSAQKMGLSCRPIGVDLVLDPMQRQPASLFFKSWMANPLQVTIIVITWFWSGNMHFESSLHFSWWPFTLIITLASAQVIIKLLGHQEKCWADQNAYYPPKSRYCYIIYNSNIDLDRSRSIIIDVLKRTIH